MDPITLNDMKNAKHKLKNDNATGEDGVCSEMFKPDEKETPYILQRILQDIWNEDIWNKEEERSHHQAAQER